MMNRFRVAACLLSTLVPAIASSVNAEGFASRVDPFIGSGGHGHVFVGASVPFGAVQVGPNNFHQGWDWCSGYHYSDSILAGFSQGGAVVLAHMLRQRVPVAGVMALSAYLPLGGKNAEERTIESAAVPVFMAHGTFDPVVPHAVGEHSRRQLQLFGHDVRFKSYPMQHSVCAEEIRDMADWLGERFAAR